MRVQTKSELLEENKKLKEKVAELSEKINASKTVDDESRAFQKAIENSSITIFITDTEGKIEYVNPFFTKLTGYSSVEVIGKNPSLLSSGHHSKEFYEELWNTIRSGNTWQGEFLNKKKDGQLYWESATIGPVLNEKGEITNFVAAKLDVTETKQALENLKKIEAERNSILRSAPIGIGLVKNRIISFVNENMCRMVGYTFEELIGQSFRILYEDDEEFNRVEDRKYKQMEADGIGSIETRLKCKDGRFVDVLLSSSFINPDNHQEGVTFTVLDITERKRAENSLKESEEKFRQLAEQSPNMIFINQKGKVVYANKMCEEVTGYSKEEFYSPDFDFKILIEPEYLEPLMQNFFEHMRGKEVPQFEYAIRTKSGEGIETIISTKLITYSGEPAILGIITDITERKRAEIALRMSEEKLRNIVEHSTNLFYSHSPDHVLTYLSPQVKAFLGYEPEEAMVRWTEFITDNPVNKKGIEATEKAIRTGQPQPPYELELKKKDGNIIWVEVHEAPVVREGKTIAIVGALTDKTERRKAEEALKQKEFFLNEAQRIANLGSYELDILSGRWTSSHILDEIFGIDESFDKSVEGWGTIVHPEEREEMLSYFYNNVLGARQKFNREYRIIRINDKEERWVHGLGELEFDENGNPVKMMGTIQDITKSKQVQQRLRDSHTRLRNLAERLQMIREEERAAVAREIHDDLGQVLTALKMDISSLQSKSGIDSKELNARIDKMLELVNSSIQTVKKIATDLRPGILDDLGLFPAIEWQVEEFQSRSNIKCSLDIRGNMNVLDDEVSIAVFRIFQETLTNITRHSKATHMNVKLLCTDSELLLEVMDDGIGITGSQLTSQKSLGIIGMRERVNILRGELHIAGYPGKGTEVKVRIPLMRSRLL